MPGIFGAIDLSWRRAHHDAPALTGIVRRMSAAMRHDPTYSEILVSSPAVGACVGRVELSAGQEQPRTERDRALFALTTGDADLDLGPYQRDGEDGLARIAAICSGFIVDERRARCLLFNDRYGRERIFLYETPTRLFFASEAKAILAVVPETRAFDPKGLAELLACGCTLGNRSLYRGIEVLEAGSVVTFDGSGVSRRRYFDRASLEQLEPASPATFLEGFSESLRAAVNASVRTGPRVGVSVTGGLDSRMIMASLDATPGSVPCYTFGSMYRTTADVAVGMQVAATCGQPHSVLELGNRFLSNLPAHLEQAVYASDGYLGLPGAAELYVNRQARSIAPARMTGNWGGELMRGVHAFKYDVPKGDFIVPELAREVGESAAAFSTASSNPLSAALFHQMPLQGYGRYAIERSQVVMRSPFLADEVVRWLYQAPSEARESSAPVVIGRRPDLLAIFTDRGLLGSGGSFMRRAWRRALIKAEYLTSHGAPDWLARISAGLPDSLIETRFLGVDKFHHFRFWMRRELAGFVRETLSSGDADLKTWFDMRRVSQMVNEHIEGRANYTNEIDKLLTVAVAQKTLFHRFQAHSR